MAKKRAKRKRPAKPAALDPAIVDAAFNLRVELHGDEPTVAALRNTLELTAAEAGEALAAAKVRLVREAGADLVEAYGEAISRYNRCFVQAMKDNDTKAAIAAQNALTKLYGFGAGSLDNSADPASTDADRDLAATRAHLEPLGLAPPDTATPELARLAAVQVADTLTHGPTPRP